MFKDDVGLDGALREEESEDAFAEVLLQSHRIRASGGFVEGTRVIESPPTDQDVEVHVQVQQSAERLHTGQAAGVSVRLVGDVAERLSERQIAGSRELGEELPVPGEEGTDPLGDRENDLPMANWLQDLTGDELREEKLPLLPARWAQISCLAAERKEKLFMTGFAANPGEASF